MSVFANQNNIYINGTFISGSSTPTAGGISIAVTGIPVKMQGLGKISLVMEGLSDAGNSNSQASFTGTVQAVVHPSQSTWVSIFSTGFNAKNSAALFQTLGQFDAVRIVLNPYYSGICNVWFTASQT